MRTTLNIEDDILANVKEMARREGVSTGRILSRLAREALTGKHLSPDAESREEKTVGGFRPFPSRDVVVSNEDVNRLRDKEGV